MCRTNGAQSLFVSALQMIQRDDGICSFKTEDITDGQFTRGRGPGQAVIGRARCLIAPRRTGHRPPCPFVLQKVEMILQTRRVPDLHHLTALFHGAVPGQLSLRLRPGLFLRTPAEHGTVGVVLDPGDQCGDTQADSSSTHFGEANSAFASVRLVGHPFFALANFLQRPGQVAIPFQSIHRQIEVGIKKEHRKGVVALGSRSCR